MKKLLSILIAAVFFTTSIPFVFADSGKDHGKSHSKSHGKVISSKASTPVIRFGKTLLPLQPVVKALKATCEVLKDGNNTRIIIKKDNITLTLTVGSNVILVTDTASGKTNEYKLDNKVESSKNGILIPMGIIQQLIRQKVDFDEDKGSINIDDNGLVNLAANAPVAASSTYGTTFSAIYAVDGKADTRWSSEFTTAAAITVDLGAVKTVGRVRISWEAAFAKVYAVQVSNDNQVWSDAAVITNGDGGIDELTFGPINARYVRLDLRERNNPAFGYSIYEFEVYSSDKKAEASIKGKAEDLLGLVNLTTDGVIDWAHWGLSDTSGFNHKAGVVQQIPNYSIVGTSTPAAISGNLVNYTWTDGIPTAGAASAAGSLYVKGEGNGFTLAIPASPTQRTLKVYVSAIDAKGRLEAKLSDGSAQYVGYIDSPAAMKCKVLTIDFKSASAGQTLAIKFTVDKTYDSSIGDISLQAITLK